MLLETIEKTEKVIREAKELIREIDRTENVLRRIDECRSEGRIVKSVSWQVNHDVIAIDLSNIGGDIPSAVREAIESRVRDLESRLKNLKLPTE